MNKTWAQSRGKINGGWFGDRERRVVCALASPLPSALLPLTASSGPGVFILSSE